ncbi:UNKNOWN [Stylonychia lemnae]|uniref:Glucokinase n=1 Tax=Stylonychia lemnae TaxID=5949 RepID=A0A078AAA3_STYLE|nr:UNKNOWN [Stylonychia lemnae]|eukprot:CDW79124.1 UNKNOWN [Stylonychia lemnae]
MNQAEKLDEQLDKYIVVGDIGGTNFRLRLSKEILEQGNPVSYEKISKKQLKAIIIAQSGCQDETFYGVGRWKDETVMKIKDHYQETRVRFMNDAEGMAYSIIAQERLSKKNRDLFVQLRDDITYNVANQSTKVKLLFSMGTGLGMATILPYPNGNSFKSFALSSEGWGKICSADEQNERQQALRIKMNSVSGINRLCCGNGVSILHQFIKSYQPKQERSKDMRNQNKIDLQSNRPADHQTIDFLIEIIGNCLAKLALATLPMGGIYISGGVANYLCDYIKDRKADKKQANSNDVDEKEKQPQSLFLKHFLIDSPMKASVLEKIPVYIIRENPTLDGLEAMLLAEQF